MTFLPWQIMHILISMLIARFVIWLTHHILVTLIRVCIEESHWVDLRLIIHSLFYRTNYISQYYCTPFITSPAALTRHYRRW